MQIHTYLTCQLCRLILRSSHQCLPFSTLRFGCHISYSRIVARMENYMTEVLLGFTFGDHVADALRTRGTYTEATR